MTAGTGSMYCAGGGSTQVEEWVLLQIRRWWWDGYTGGGGTGTPVVESVIFNSQPDEENVSS